MTANRTGRIALIGDFKAEKKAHRGIPLALALGCAAIGRECAGEWVPTATLPEDPAELLREFDGIWCVPGSPYVNTRGALAAIRFARESGRPFLGTCGGFQHALLEYAGSVWDVPAAAHAELEPGAADPVIAPLACPLLDAASEVRFEPGSRLASIYGAPAAVEEYHCRYGLSPRYATRLADGPLVACARDDAGEVRAVELHGHPFFLATLFQPERSGLTGRRHPLVTAFVAAVCEHAAGRASSVSRPPGRRSGGAA